MSGLLDVLNRCADDLASMSERERHYNRTSEEAWSESYKAEQMDERNSMALVTIALALACDVQARYTESPDCVPKVETRKDGANLNAALARAMDGWTPVTSPIGAP